MKKIENKLHSFANHWIRLEWNPSNKTIIKLGDLILIFCYYKNQTFYTENQWSLITLIVLHYSPPLTSISYIIILDITKSLKNHNNQRKFKEKWGFWSQIVGRSLFGWFKPVKNSDMKPLRFILMPTNMAVIGLLRISVSK